MVSSQLVPSRFHRPSSPISARTRTCDRKDATEAAAPEGALRCRRSWPDRRWVEIFLDDHTVNVRELLGDLDQRLT